MATDAKEKQILGLLQNSTSVLVCLPERPTTDAIASGLAMMAVIEKLGKRGRIVSSGFVLPKNHAFLPKSDEIFDDLPALNQFIINLSTEKASVEELSYDIENDRLRIYIQPKDGFFEERDVTVEPGDFSYDLIVTLDSPDMDHLGRVYEHNAEFFYHTPIVNIDHTTKNDHYGQIDLVNVTATSVSEVLFELVKHWSEDAETDVEGILDEYIATNLLTGMISKTKSFRSGSVTPRSLAVASHLIDQGARRDEIVRHLYQSKQVNTLKLWGRVLSKLESDSEYSIVWSKLNRGDFEAADASSDALPDLIDELIINTPDAKNVFILYVGEDNETQAIVSTAPYIDAKQLFAEFEPEGSHHFVRFAAHDLKMNEVQEAIIEKIQGAHGTKEQ